MNYFLICFSVYYAVVAALTFNKMMEESDKEGEEGWIIYFSLACLIWPIMFLVIDIIDWTKNKK